jgi:hypothetical protein
MSSVGDRGLPRVAGASVCTGTGLRGAVRWTTRIEELAVTFLGLAVNGLRWVQRDGETLRLRLVS